LESILNFDDQLFDDGELFPAADTLESWDVTVQASSSDSGVASDQQLLPILQEADLLSCLCNGSESNPSEASHVYGNHKSSVLEDVGVCSSVFDMPNAGCLEVRVEDNQAIFSVGMFIISLPKD
jgi:hypothetical protein